MDISARFILIAKRILLELRTLNETEPIAKEQQAKKEKDAPDPEMGAILNSLQGIQAEQRAGNPSQDWTRVT
jgi:hypothetical protein